MAHSALLASAAILTVGAARAEIWTWANTTATNVWSTTGNWAETTGAGAVTGSPPGTAGSTYTGVRLNINGNVDYTATQGTQTYDISAAAGENRALAIGATDFNSGKTLSVSGTGANLTFVPETGVAGVLIGVGTGNSYAGQASLAVNDGATFKVQTSLGAITGDIAILTRGLATASGTLTIGGTGTGTLVSSDTVSFGAIAAPSAGATGTVNLNSGGTLQTRKISAAANSNGSSYATVNFNGGTLKSADTDNSETLISGTNGLAVKLLAGGGTIDTNGQTGQSIDAVISGTAGGSLTKSGSGTLTLTSVNTYNGATTINGGTLALNSTGSINNSSGVSLGNSGTFDVSAKSGYTVAALTGAGNVLGALTVSTTLAIGDSPGTTHFSSDLTLGSLATYTHELTGGSNTADLGNIAGNLTISTGAVLDLVQLGTYTANDKFTLFSYTGTFSGLFKDVTSTTLADGATFTDAGGIWMIDYNDTSAGLNGGTGTSFVTVTAVPEPNTAMLFGGLGWFLVFRRRRNESPVRSRSKGHSRAIAP